MHWAFQYLDKKWVKGGRGPDSFDCWGLVYWIYKTHLNQELPLYPTIDASDLVKVTEKITEYSTLPDWIPLDKPQDLCIVAMSKNIDTLHHVGLFLDIDGGLILHATPNAFVIAQTERDLVKWGYRRIEYYHYKDKICAPT